MEVGKLISPNSTPTPDSDYTANGASRRAVSLTRGRSQGPAPQGQYYYSPAEEAGESGNRERRRNPSAQQQGQRRPMGSGRGRSHSRSQSQSGTGTGGSLSNIYSAPASPAKPPAPREGSMGDTIRTSSTGTSLANFTENLKGLFSGSLSSLTSAAQYMGSASTPAGLSNGYQSASTNLSPAGFRRTSGGIIPGSSHRGSSSGRERCKTLLIIDEPHTDWSKYFKGRLLNNEWEIRLEQAEFKEINLAAYTDEGAIVDMQLTKGGTRVVRSFKPDFVLIRQYVKDARDDWRNILLGLVYGNVPALNSLESIYNFQDKPRVFADLIKIQKKIGKEQFPLIEQAYYPNYKELMITPKFPIVVKIGHSHSGNGKIKIDNHYDFQDITSIIAVTDCYSVIEPYVDSKYDIHIQKIGNHYKAFMRKSISGNWKANMGSSMLEEIPVNEKYKLWVDECAKLYGGLDIVAVEALKSKDGREIIFQVNDSSMNLLGESQEENRQHIADLTIEKMERLFDLTKRDSLSYPEDTFSARKVSTSSKAKDPRHSLSHQQTLKQLGVQDSPSRIESDGGISYTTRVNGKPTIVPVGDLSDSSSDNMTPASSVKSGASLKTGVSAKKVIPPSHRTSDEGLQYSGSGLVQGARQAPPVPPHPKPVKQQSSTSLTQQTSAGYGVPQPQASQRYPGQAAAVNAAMHGGPPAHQQSSSVASNQAAFRYPGQSPMKAPSQTQPGRQNVSGSQIRSVPSQEGRDESDPRLLNYMNHPSGSASDLRNAPQNLGNNLAYPSNTDRDVTRATEYAEAEARAHAPRTGAGQGLGLGERTDSKDIVGDTMGNLRKTFAGIFGDM